MTWALKTIGTSSLSKIPCAYSVGGKQFVNSERLIVNECSDQQRLGLGTGHQNRYREGKLQSKGLKMDKGEEKR